MTSPDALLKTQRSHVLFVLSNAKPGHESAFLQWYQWVYAKSVVNIGGILSASLYEQHEVDITQGQYPRLPMRYLCLCEISVDGAEAAGTAIGRIARLHGEQGAALEPATWLYYPVSEKAGRAAAATQPCMLTLAFANAVPAREAEFREWYATRHIRHALNIPALVSGQCFERTLFQKPGALEASFSMIAIYQQEGTAESIVQSFISLPESTFDFPAMDAARTRFAEAVFRPLYSSIR